MTKQDALKLLIAKVEEIGQSEVARQIGYSPSAVSQALSGTYRGSLDNMLTRVEEKFGSSTVDCPVQGEISLGKCAENRSRPFAATNPLRVRLWRACQGCERNHK